MRIMETTTPTLIDEQVAFLTGMLQRVEKAITKNQEKVSSLPDTKQNETVKKGLSLIIENDMAYVAKLKSDIAGLKEKNQ